jgi:tRNA U34 5-methylaminomethyl-2-thiouridine-forming methyltransferase MnmC
LRSERLELYQPLRTDDGSLTLVHPFFGEAYGSRYGAWMQANQLYLRLTHTHQHPGPRVLEVGFGLGVNFRATLQNCLNRGVPLQYLGYEGFPVSAELLAAVEVPLAPRAQESRGSRVEGLGSRTEVPLLPRAQAIWEALLSCWASRQSEQLALRGDWGWLEVRFLDVAAADFPAEWASAIYLDPFSPEVNPEPWQPQVLHRLFCSGQPGARLATYSVAGQFRRDLQAAGFAVTKLPGIGKKEWTVGERPP